MNSLQYASFCNLVNLQANKENDEVYTQLTLLPLPEVRPIATAAILMSNLDFCCSMFNLWIKVLTLLCLAVVLCSICE